ncbi:MAG TPA: conjugal transfer protein TraD [Candidatus Aphodousia faecavium]|nr:conjugal transfer protein TraD [Candidatus Aphodousia faecavium]
MSEEQTLNTQTELSESIPVDVTQEKLKRAANPIDDVEFTEEEAQALGAFTEEAVSEDEVLKSADLDNLNKPL